MSTPATADLATSPNPPWTGMYFDCSTPNCPARYQLCASDECAPFNGINEFLAPRCWHCGLRNIVTIRENSREFAGNSSPS